MNDRQSQDARRLAQLADKAVHRGPAAFQRWANLIRFRARFGHDAFGDGCDIRGGFRATVADGGSMRFGRDCVLDRDLTVEATGTLEVGERTIFGHHCTVAAKSLVTIGACCLLAEMVSVRDHDHEFADLGVPVRDQGSRTADVVIGYNVWVGAKASILKGVTIGDNAIIGAHAVVTHDIPANAIAVGIPARVLRFREN